MKQHERQWMRDTRCTIRLALISAENDRWDQVVRYAASLMREAAQYHHDKIEEVKDLLASLAAAAPSEFGRNIAMRAAAVRRLEEIKALIGDALVATTDR